MEYYISACTHIPARASADRWYVESQTAMRQLHRDRTARSLYIHAHVCSGTNVCSIYACTPHRNARAAQAFFLSSLN